MQLKLLQYSNALRLTLVTLSGKTIASNELQLANAEGERSTTVKLGNIVLKLIVLIDVS